MKFNKSHEVWKSAPWYISFSLIGINSLKALVFFTYLTFFVGLGCYMAVVAQPAFADARMMHMFELGTGLGLAACWYFMAIIWVKDNPDSMEK